MKSHLLYPIQTLHSLADVSEGYQINSIILSPQRDRHILVWVCALNKTRPQGGWVLQAILQMSNYFPLMPVTVMHSVPVSAVLTGVTTAGNRNY